ncbi:DUF3786 domain-containing protein [Novisyntrophococcus fermenticellae]|uniref:DUF3786 domain-containing protein n=1 Tax=Novisyntrophococcus fermenticellae TaxID=2068655 RepID=UPI001E5E7333|nr:DUF3786 domain-containing protein [Novisyntrophococcus fermenticellae]
MDFGYEKDSKERLPFEHYLKVYQDLKPEEISQRTGIPYDSETSTFRLRLMGVTYKITHPDYVVTHTDGEKIGWFPLEQKTNARILVLRFLTSGTAAPSFGKFLTYREIPWGEVYFKQFHGRCILRLAYGFGNRTEQFEAIMDKIGGEKLDIGDASYEFEFLNELRLRMILWAGDDEFPPSAQILFSDNFPVAFNQGEDMAVVGDVSIDMLKELQKAL